MNVKIYGIFAASFALTAIALISCSNLVLFTPLTSQPNNYEPNDTLTQAKRIEFYAPDTNNYDNHDDDRNSRGIVSYLTTQSDIDYYYCSAMSNQMIENNPSIDARFPNSKFVITHLSGSGFTVQVLYSGMLTNTIVNISNSYILDAAHKQITYREIITNAASFVTNSTEYQIHVRINGLQDQMRPAAYAVIHCVTNYYVATN